MLHQYNVYVAINLCSTIFLSTGHRNTLLERLTCTDDSISSVARVARIVETPFCVTAVCILMTVVKVINLTYIYVWIKTEIDMHHDSKHMYDYNIKYENINPWYVLTTAAKSICIQVISCVTTAVINDVSAIVLRASICSVAFINIYGKTKCNVWCLFF